MKYIAAIMVTAMLLFSGIGAIASPESDTTNQTLETHESIKLQTQIQNSQQKTTVLCNQANTYTTTPGLPNLPTITKTYTYPLGTTINSIDITFEGKQTYELEAKLATTPAPQTQNSGFSAKLHTLDSSVESYPETSYSIRKNVGIIGDEQTLFVTVTLNPIQYHPQQNALSIYDSVDIKIDYTPAAQSFITADEYDMVIIGPQKFANALQPLVEHKNSIGITTILVTLEEIYDSTYFPVEGRDCAEEVKYFIKDARESWGAQYVLLVGGIKYGLSVNNWWTPVRYSHVLDDAGEERFVSDLYFSDLYKIEDNETVFDDWDPDGDDVFAEWTNEYGNKEIIDCFPDIHVGRLPVLATFEVNTMVNKIITYETEAYGSDWFKRIISVGGDSAVAAGDIWNEGEVEGQYAIDYVGDDFEAIKLWTSLGTFTGQQDIIDGISEGAGLMIFDGHGNPFTWSTHPPGDTNTWITGLNLNDMWKLKNKDQLPVTVIGGCHNGQFETNLGVIWESIKENGIAGTFFEAPYKFYHFEWVPRCWAWMLASVANGGSIASMAYTGFDWFQIGDGDDDGIPDCTQRLSGFFNTNFFKNYGENNIEVLGECYSQTITDYGNTWPPMDETLDAKTMMELTLMGDPSLQIGGIES